MESRKSANEPERPELSDSDIQWLKETIGIEILRDYKWNSIDYARSFEFYFDRAEKCQLNAQNADGNSPLHLVAISENYAAIDALLMCGADVNALNSFKQTPVTYSQQCPDYNVGFQFFRHLHKLDFLEQHICKENSEWYCQVRKIYKENYPRDGHIAAFTQNPSLTEEMILKIRAGGEDVIYQMYQKELQLIKHSQIKKRPLSKILNLTDRNDVAENRLRELKKYMKFHNFHNKYPTFGFMFKRKYRQSLEHYESCKLEPESPLSSLEKSGNKSCNNSRQATGSDYAKSLQIETDRSMQECMTRKDTVVIKLMKKSKQHKEIDERKAADARSFSEHDVTSKGVVENQEKNKLPELSSDEKLAKLRKMMARLHTK